MPAGAGQAALGAAVAFRDRDGKYGLVDEFCAHRGVSLWFGRNEERGLRCPYHGWKYDVTGQCVEVPSEPVKAASAGKIKLRSYPLVKRGALLWAYMGPPEKQPPLPEWEFATVAADQCFVSKRLQECNWLQAMEGGIDSAMFRSSTAATSVPTRCSRAPRAINTISPTHSRISRWSSSREGCSSARAAMPRTATTTGASRRGSCRPFTMIPPRGDHPIHGHFWIPIDDENCWTWSYDFHPVRPLTRPEVDAMRDGAGVHCKYLPGTYRPLANKDNDYLIDRAAQRAGKTFSGVAGFAIQDASLQESMGPICDRTKENLVSTDNGIIMARHRLMRAAKALVEKASPRPASIPPTIACARHPWCCRRTRRSRMPPGRHSRHVRAWR